MTLELFFNITTILEIIIIEFITIWMLSEKKHGFPASLGLYTAITLLLLFFMCFVAVRYPGYGDGSGRFMFLGALYFIPAFVNYGGDWKSRIIIAFYAFSYGLAGFGSAVRIAYLFDPKYLSIAALAAQTLLYALTFPMFLKFSKKQLIKYIQKSSGHQKNMLIRYTIASFILIIAYNKSMVTTTSQVRKLLVYLLLLYFIILSYRLFVSYLKADDSNQELSEMIKADRLTGLGNRAALRECLDTLCDAGTPFCLFFLDLDNFKFINDKYGHLAGDKYLCSFADALKECSGEEGMCFRIAGDEFICVSHDQQLLEKIKNISPQKVDDMEFIGVSIGMAKYPDEAQSLSGLIHLADQRMYKYKLKQHSIR